MRNTAGLGVNQVMFPVWQIHHTNTVALKGGYPAEQGHWRSSPHCLCNISRFPKSLQYETSIGNDIENNLRGEEGEFKELLKLFFDKIFY